MADVPVSGRGGATPSSTPTPIPSAIARREPAPHPGPEGLGKTRRTDPWWVEWVSVSGGLIFLGLYAFWASTRGPFYDVSYQPLGTPYLSPFNSPEFLLWRHHPAFVPAGLVALIAILGFRGTCYYYRKAYYRAFFADPPGCAVSESRKSYCGETQLPFTLQNAHRYFLYLALVAMVFLWIDVIRAFDWGGHFGIGVGSLLMLVNICLISGYTFGCHSLRHLIGGGNNCMSCHPAQQKAWSIASIFNGKHQQWAWGSLISVCATDLYIRLIGMHVLPVDQFLK